MSVVTNVIAAFGLCGNENEQALLDEINAQNGLDYPAGNLIHVEVDKNIPHKWYGGSKRLEVNIAIAAFNHLNLKEWVQNIRDNVDLAKYGCGYLQFIVQDQESWGFGIIDVWNDPDQFNPFEWSESDD